VETREEVKTTTWHVLPSRAITHVAEHVAIFNDSDRDAHVEVLPSGEVIVKPLDFGRLIISFLSEETP
jgi:hypothetical protein